jgi:ABC-type amino acid transport substrate-binding protein
MRSEGLTGLVRPRILACLLAGALALVSVAIWAHFRQRDLTQRTFRIGYENSPPDQLEMPDGSAGGPAIEIIKEAARRRGMRIEWVREHRGPEEALTSGAVDLWPMFSDLPGRRSRFFISRPWCSRRFWIVVRQDSSISSLDQLNGRTIAVRNVGTEDAIARMYQPGVKVARESSFTDIFRAVCTGEADAGLVWERLGRSTLVDMPTQCAGQTFRYVSPPSAYLYAGLGAAIGNEPARQAASAIRAEISKLAAEGTVAEIYFKWVRQSTNDTLVIDLLDDAKTRSIQLSCVATLVVLIALVVAWQNRRIRVERRAAEEARDRATQATASSPSFWRT